jgi:hypothetical protein
MARNKDITSLEQLLERIGEADGDGDRVSLGAIHASPSLARRSARSYP